MFNNNVFLTVLSYVLSVLLGIGLLRLYYAIRVSKANVNATKIIDDAVAKADNIVKESILDAKTQAYELKLEAEKEIKEQKQQSTDFENKLLQREQNIDRRDLLLQSKEDAYEQRVSQFKKKEVELNKLEEQLKEKIDAKIVELEKIAAMTASEAKAELFKQVEQKMSKEVTAYIKEQEEEANNKASMLARDIIATAINRYAQEETVEKTVSVVALPSEEMKGRIIGREGRNIKSIEQFTGV